MTVWELLLLVSRYHDINRYIPRVLCHGQEVVDVEYVLELDAVVLLTDQPTATTPHRVTMEQTDG